MRIFDPHCVTTIPLLRIAICVLRIAAKCHFTFSLSLFGLSVLRSVFLGVPLATCASPRRLSRFSGQAARCQAAAVPHRCGCRCDFPSILAQTSLAGASHTFKPSTLATTQTATPAAATPAAATPAAATPAATARQTLSLRGGEGDRSLNRVASTTINDATARTKPPNPSSVGKAGFDVWVLTKF